MSQTSTQNPLLPDGQASRQRVRDAGLSAMQLKNSIAKIEREIQDMTALMETECSDIMKEKPLTPWIIAAGVFIFANLLWSFGFISLAGVALYIWAVLHYRKNWTREARAAKHRLERKSEIAVLRNTLDSLTSDLAQAEKSLSST